LTISEGLNHKDLKEHWATPGKKETSLTFLRVPLWQVWLNFLTFKPLVSEELWATENREPPVAF